MLETLIFALVLLLINFLFVFRPVPIIAIPVGLLTWYITATEFLGNTELPVQPLFSLFLLLVSACMMLVNALSTRNDLGERNQ